MWPAIAASDSGYTEEPWRGSDCTRNLLFAPRIMPRWPPVAATARNRYGCQRRRAARKSRVIAAPSTRPTGVRVVARLSSTHGRERPAVVPATWRLPLNLASHTHGSGPQEPELLWRQQAAWRTDAASVHGTSLHEPAWISRYSHSVCRRPLPLCGCTHRRSPLAGSSWSVARHRTSRCRQPIDGEHRCSVGRRHTLSAADGQRAATMWDRVRACR